MLLALLLYLALLTAVLYVQPGLVAGSVVVGLGALLLSAVEDAMWLVLLPTVAVIILLNTPAWRRRFLIRPAYAMLRKAMPEMSKTEREALEAGAQLPGDISFGIALHLGDVFYGNIGASDRLDFTVIGSAVNEASRVEGMCKVLGQELLLTGAFAERCDPRLLRSLGSHTLRGVERAQELFTLAEPPV